VASSHTTRWSPEFVLDKNDIFQVESTERAIAEVNGSLVGGVQLKVSLARRQPVIDPINDASSRWTVPFV
jgi:hypothetical protein